MNEKRRFLLVLIYIICLVVLFEGTARLAFLIPQVSRHLLVQDDLSWRRRWINRHRETGKGIYYQFDIYDSTKGWISKPNLRDMTVFDGKVLNTNSKGFRGINEYTYGKNQDKVRILVLGDSFTFGDGVSDNETYSFYLQEMIPAAEVINLGVHGYGHDQMLILLREEGIKYKPDIIVLGFVDEDMTRNLLNFRDYAKPKFVLSNNELRLKGTPVPTPEETIEWDWARPRIVDVVLSIHHSLSRFTGSYFKEEKDVTTAILSEIVNLADSIHAIPIFVYLPYGRAISNQSISIQSEDYFFAMCRSDDRVTCFSARPWFAEKLNKGMTFKNFHWGPAGHLTVAEAIHSFLDDGGYMAICNSKGNSDFTKPYKSLEHTRQTAQLSFHVEMKDAKKYKH